MPVSVSLTNGLSEIWVRGGRGREGKGGGPPSLSFNIMQLMGKYRCFLSFFMKRENTKFLLNVYDFFDNKTDKIAFVLCGLEGAGM